MHWLVVWCDLFQMGWSASLYRRHRLIPRGPDGDLEW